MSHTDPGFVLSSEEYSCLDTSPEPIRLGEWRDLAFFARPIRQPGEDYLTGFQRAFNQSDGPVELRSKSKYRLAWMDVEFLREDVMREWANVELGAEPDPTHQKAPGLPFDGIAGGAVEAGLSAGRMAPVSDRDLRTWYQQRVRALTTRGETSSGEQDYVAAKQEFGERVTRARLRAVRKEVAPVQWRQQGRPLSSERRLRNRPEFGRQKTTAADLPILRHWLSETTSLSMMMHRFVPGVLLCESLQSWSQARIRELGCLSPTGLSRS
jgi:hypothetical protein